MSSWRAGSPSFARKGYPRSVHPRSRAILFQVVGRRIQEENWPDAGQSRVEPDAGARSPKPGRRTSCGVNDRYAAAPDSGGWTRFEIRVPDFAEHRVARRLCGAIRAGFRAAVRGRGSRALRIDEISWSADRRPTYAPIDGPLVRNPRLGRSLPLTARGEQGAAAPGAWYPEQRISRTTVGQRWGCTRITSCRGQSTC